ncbi:MAG: hypothetical protein FDZ75_01515 [Actinobacteria bacterium]|nr:MAG: hypothetical protein FDZ75_01515 [Actinomycetota bacterium]
MTLALAFALLAWPAQCMAWDKAAAATYAETYAYNANPAWPYFSGSDCTNFISQALRSGGIAMDTTRTDRSKWYMAKNINGAWIWGYPWTVAQDFYTYFRTSPRTSAYRYYISTYDWNTATSYPTPPSNNVSLSRGDIVSYDWNTSARDGVDHNAIVTANGTDAHNASYSGDLVCYHSTDTRRIIWHVKHRLSYAQQQQISYSCWGLSSALN